MLNPQIKCLPEGITVKKNTGNSKLFILTVYKNDQIIGSIPSPIHVWNDTKELSFISGILVDEKTEGITHKATLLKSGSVLFTTNNNLKGALNA